jgi:hypothetical protein
MSTPCTWHPVRTSLRTPAPGPRGGHRGGHRPRHRCTAASGPEVVIRRVATGAPMTVAELRHAAAVLGRHVASGRMDVAVALVRVAVQLEALGA